MGSLGPVSSSSGVGHLRTRHEAHLADLLDSEDTWAGVELGWVLEHRQGIFRTGELCCGQLVGRHRGQQDVVLRGLGFGHWL